MIYRVGDLILEELTPSVQQIIRPGSLNGSPYRQLIYWVTYRFIYLIELVSRNEFVTEIDFTCTLNKRIDTGITRSFLH